MTFTKLIKILQSNNFETTENRDELWGLVLRGSISDWWKIRFDILLRIYLNKQRDLICIRPFLFVVNNSIFNV